jgi:hypothetical protein
MTPDLSINILPDPQYEIVQKWRALLEYTEGKLLPIPQKHHIKAALLFERVEKALKHLLDSSNVHNHLPKTIIPFFRKNYEYFLDCDHITMEHFPLNIAHGQLGNIIHKYESDLMGNHLWEHDLVNLWKINDKFWLI